MSRKILVITICLLTVYRFALGGGFDHEVITMFQEGVVHMPEGAESAAVSEVDFEPEIIRDILLEHTAEEISVAFPDFDPKDTLVESPRFPGLFARQARLDLVYKIQLSEETLRDQLNTALEELDEVYFSDKNGMGESCYTPNDTCFSKQWGMHNVGQTNGVFDADIDAPEAWDLAQGNSLTVIGILDTGVYPVLDLQERVSGEDPGFNDHGTFVAGVAAAQGDNDSAGIAGVTWHSHIYSKNVEGYDDVDVYDSVIDAVTNGGADVLNISWGSFDFSNLSLDSISLPSPLWEGLGVGRNQNKTRFLILSRSMKKDVAKCYGL